MTLRFGVALLCVVAQFAAACWLPRVPRPLSVPSIPPATMFDVLVQVNGQMLNDRDVERRYGLPHHHQTYDPMDALIGAVFREEEAANRHDGAEVLIRYRSAERPQHEWRWSSP